MLQYALGEKCPNTELFLVRIFPHSKWIRARNNSVFGHFFTQRRYGSSKTDTVTSSMSGYANAEGFCVCTCVIALKSKGIKYSFLLVFKILKFQILNVKFSTIIQLSCVHIFCEKKHIFRIEDFVIDEIKTWSYNWSRKSVNFHT